MALLVAEAVEAEVADPVCALLEATLGAVAHLVRMGSGPVSEARRIDRIALWERLRGVVAAGQAAELVRFAHARVDRELAEGRLSDRVAEVVVNETRHLDGRLRRLVDAEVAQAGISGMSVNAATACIRKHAYEADRVGFVERGRRERRHRRVGLRPVPDTMAVLTAYLPVEQGVACLAALRAHTDHVVAVGDPDGRSRDQVMADTLVKRLTGQATAGDVPFEVQVVVPLELATDPSSSRTATLSGVGPLPGGLAHAVVDASRAVKRRRHVPSCGAPARHLDHVTPYAQGGETAGTNGQTTCERHNYAKQASGWTTTVTHDGTGHESHTVVTTTPTGHTYESRAPDPP